MERLGILFKAAHALSLDEQPDASFCDLFMKLAEHMDVEVCMVYRLDEDGERLRLVASLGLPEGVAQARETVALGHDVHGRVAQRRQELILEDLGRTRQSATESIEEMGLRSLACYPLLAAEVLIGTVGFGSRRHARFTPDALAILELLAAQIAAALERAQLLGSIRRQDEKWAEHDQQRNDFLAMMAHELRNPLAPILNAVEVLRLRRQVTPELEPSVTMVERQTRHLERLIDDLLDLSRMTRGQIQLRLERLDARMIVNRAVEDVHPIIDRRCHELFVTLPTEPLWLEADAVRLEQILVNLLANAAKYTEPGGRIWLELDLQPGEAVFRVRDSGIGIAPEVLPIIFNPFIQADKSLDRAQGGLGVGLTLVRRLAEMHQGTVGVHSAGIGKGSEFVLRLPALVEPAPAETLSQPEFLADGAPLRRVLLVEDNVDAARSLGELLEIWGHEVHLAYDGLEAVEAACRTKPEVVLLDIGLPGMDGYQVARALRREPAFPPLLIVAVTGYGQSEDLARSQEAGIDHHLVKPIDLGTLKALIQ